METSDQHNTRQKSSSKVKHIREKATTIKSTGQKVLSSLEKKERLTNSIKSFKKIVKKINQKLSIMRVDPMR